MAASLPHSVAAMARCTSVLMAASSGAAFEDSPAVAAGAGCGEGCDGWTFTLSPVDFARCIRPRASKAQTSNTTSNAIHFPFPLLGEATLLCTRAGRIALAALAGG